MRPTPHLAVTFFQAVTESHKTSWEEQTKWKPELYLCAARQEDSNLQRTLPQHHIQIPDLPQMLQMPVSKMLSRSQIFLPKTGGRYCIFPSAVYLSCGGKFFKEEAVKLNGS